MNCIERVQSPPKNEPKISQIIPVNMGIEDMEKREETLFNETFDVITEKLTSTVNPDLRRVSDWLKKVLVYNVPHGKKNRGMALALAYQVLKKNKKLDSDKSHQARILGWCIEILQAFFLIHDDIMDQSLTRRGQPCWYKKEDVGLIAINDGILLNSCIYKLLKENFSKEPTYSQILDLFHEITDLTIKGQCLDMLNSTPDMKNNPAAFTEDVYSAIIEYKTAHYSFVLPIRLAFYLVGIVSEEVHAKAEEILLKFGHFFQVQDDFLDCYGDPSVIGKVGRDIEEGKCCWLFVNALKLCSEEQKKILVDNYALEDPAAVAKVREIYDQLNMRKVFQDYEDESYKEIKGLIDSFAYSQLVPLEVFNWLLKKIYRRNK
ncbi:uncharacterized protein LOC128395909 isoform X2 [Panonychus citri]|uniref:Farnesyl pyrophosphate synthase n=1 Tax=Panonychus citri TaxID=50023 RepID=A0A411KAL7_PANCT|nr:uncharacterized protein LOC128395909 isoform X2 [Panonychus citri]XP_053212374.1 uncharacterized protein LOC128395909 isoform X2 [Panonychus citri]XP_053212375.1 uncharacterized protein LOC128395909 isoform X2 [Panonychus citri]QBC75338.1 FPPS [Panonychus citri]